VLVSVFGCIYMGISELLIDLHIHKSQNQVLRRLRLTDRNERKHSYKCGMQTLHQLRRGSRMVFHVREAGLRTNPDTRLPRAHYIIATLLPIRSRSVYLIEWYIRARERETCDIFAAGFSLKSIANVFVRWTRVVRFELCVLENFNVIWLQVDRVKRCRH